MYCPSCGAQLQQTLSYCNRCGANLSPLKDLSETPSRPQPINSLIWAIVVTTIILLGMGLGALVLMRDGRIDEGLGRIFVMLCFLTLPIIEGLLVWQLLSSNRRVKRLSKAPQNISQSDQENISQSDQLGTATARSLADPGEPVSSIAEHTTRAFEPSYRNRERS